MRLRVIILAIMIGIFGSSYSQEAGTASASRLANIKHMLDYRYKGGFYTFQKLFIQTVKYPPMAAHHCAIGIVIVAFQVDCDGNVGDIRMKTPLYYGIKEEITKFLDATTGNWNLCDDERYTKFEIPIQFTLDDVETNTEDGVLVCTDDIQGLTCNDDEYYLKRAKKALEKGSNKRALKNLAVLIQRNPYSLEYYDMRKEALEEK